MNAVFLVLLYALPSVPSADCVDDTTFLPMGFVDSTQFVYMLQRKSADGRCEMRLHVQNLATDEITYSENFSTAPEIGPLLEKHRITQRRVKVHKDTGELSPTRRFRFRNTNIDALLIHEELGIKVLGSFPNNQVRYGLAGYVHMPHRNRIAAIYKAWSTREEPELPLEETYVVFGGSLSTGFDQRPKTTELTIADTQTLPETVLDQVREELAKHGARLEQAPQGTLPEVATQGFCDRAPLSMASSRFLCAEATSQGVWAVMAKESSGIWRYDSTVSVYAFSTKAAMSKAVSIAVDRFAEDTVGPPLCFAWCFRDIFWTPQGFIAVEFDCGGGGRAIRTAYGILASTASRVGPSKFVGIRGTHSGWCRMATKDDFKKSVGRSPARSQD